MLQPFWSLFGKSPGHILRVQPEVIVTDAPFAVASACPLTWSYFRLHAHDCRAAVHCDLRCEPMPAPLHANSMNEKTLTANRGVFVRQNDDTRQTLPT